MKKRIISTSFSAIILMMMVISGCKDDPKPDLSATINAPTVVTSEVSAITQVSAMCGGEVTSDGGAEVTAYGVCWSTSPSPTIDDQKIISGSGKGVFASELTGLSLGTTYYVAAFATNSKGTSYGEERSFTTDATLALGLAHAGGIIFYLDSTGEHGYVCTDTSIAKSPWGCKGTEINGAGGTGIGSGYQNTLDILAECTTISIAAKFCTNLNRNGYSDWFLPSRDELIAISENVHQKGIGKLPVGYFWSSNQAPTAGGPADYAAIVGMTDAHSQYSGKDAFLNVIAVRAF